MTEKYHLNPLHIRLDGSYLIQVSANELLQANAPEYLELLARITPASKRAVLVALSLSSKGSASENVSQFEELVRSRILVPQSQLVAHTEGVLRPKIDGYIRDEVEKAVKKYPSHLRGGRERRPKPRPFILDVLPNESRRPFIAHLLLNAVRQGFTVKSTLTNSVLQLAVKKGRHERVFTSQYSVLAEPDARAESLSTIKWAANYLCGQAGIPVPAQALCKDVGSAERFIEKVGFPVVIKPIEGWGGTDVYPNLGSLERVREVIELLKPAWSNRLIIEKHIFGNNYRLLVLGNEVISIYAGLPPIVVGDGVATIRALIAAENERRYHARRFEHGENAVVIDEELKGILRVERLTLGSVLPKGKRLQVHYNLNRSRGTRVRIIAPRTIHPAVRQMAVKAVRLFGFHYAAIDYVSTSLTSSPAQTGGVICEVQTGPMLPSPPINMTEFVQHMLAYRGDSRRPSATLKVVRQTRTSS